MRERKRESEWKRGLRQQKRQPRMVETRSCMIYSQDDLKGNKREIAVVKGKDVVLKTDPRERLQTWVQHFSKVLNRAELENPVDNDNLGEIDEIKEIDLGAWRVQEVTNALKTTKRGKAARVDEVRPDLLRADK